MVNELYLWLLTFVSIFLGFLICMIKTKKRRLYTIYFILGMMFGFYFDFISFTNGYYSYPSFFIFKMAGLPLGMTIAEGFAIVIFMNIFEIIKKVIVN